MSLDESSVLMDRALVTMCQDLPESLGLYNTDKDQFSLIAIRTVPLLEHVRPDTRKLALIIDWMRAFEPAEDQPLSVEINIESFKETVAQERKQREQELQSEEEAQNMAKRDEKKKKKEKKKKTEKKKKKQKKETTFEKEKRNRVEKKRTRGRKRRVEVDSDDSEVVIDESSSSSDESSSSSSSDSDTNSRVKKRTKTLGNLPPIEMVLSSDEDEEPNEMFDTDDPDVYEVEKILRKKKGETYGEQDLYEVKWEGYDETTWEPASNISKDLIDEFEGQPVREDVYTVEEIIDRRNKRDAKTRLKTHQYKVKWVGYDDLTWEPAENLPHNLRRKFDQKYDSRKRR